MNLAERDLSVIWRPYTQMLNADLPVAIVKGEGALVFDEYGKAYVDAISSWWVNIHGHCHPYINQKITDQVQTLEHVIFAGFTHEPAVRLAERLLELLPSNQKRVFYSDNGSTAVEVALKMAFQYFKNQGRSKPKVIALKHSYHGDTFGAMSVSSPSAFTSAFKDHLFDVDYIPVPVKGFEEQSKEALAALIPSGSDNYAAFIFEPLVMGAGGMLMYEPTVLNDLIRMARKQGILCIADEVMTGFGRTGKNFACDHLDEKPDIMCFSKGITAGYIPMGLTSCSQDLFNAFLSEDKGHTFYHGHSYTGNTLACAIGNASLDLLLTPETKENINRIENSHADFVRTLSSQDFNISTRQRGTILAIEIESGDESSYFNPIRTKIPKFFLEEGVLIRPLGNVIYVLPPYCITEDQLQLVYDAILKFLKSL